MCAKRDNVAIIGYLLGVSDYVMERDYSNEYTYILSSNCFTELKIVRCLSRVRNTILKNYKQYKNKSLESVDSYLRGELQYLCNNNINLYDVSKLNTDTSYLLNHIKKLVDSKVFKLLEDIGIAYNKELMAYFYFPQFDKKSLLSFTAKISTLSSPQGIVLFKYKKIVNSYPYTLTNDKTLYFTAMSLNDIPYSEDLLNSVDYDWSKIGVILTNNVRKYVAKTVAIREESGLDNKKELDKKVDTILQEVKEGVLKEDSDISNTESVEIGNSESQVGNECAITVKTDITIDNTLENKDEIDCVEDNTKEYLVGNISTDVAYEYNITKEQRDSIELLNSTDVYFVDCDNIDFFKFLSFVDILDELGVCNKKFYLYNDIQASQLWTIVDKLKSESTNSFVIKKVDRIKHNKSVVDMVMTVDICKEIIGLNNAKIGLLSSDSDFFGLLENMEADFLVGYCSDCTNNHYLNYINTKGYNTIDINLFESKSTLMKYKELVVKYLVLQTLSMIAIVKWNKITLLSSLKNAISKESTYTLSKEYIIGIIDRMLNNIQVNFVDNDMILSSDGLAIKVDTNVFGNYN